MDQGETEIERIGWIAWLRGSRARVMIVRDGDIAAAVAALPPHVKVLRQDSRGDFVVYELPNGSQRIRFRARAAWLPNEPTVMPNNTRITKAALLADGKVLVLEGLHRTRAMARERLSIDPRLGGVARAAGWLDFSFDPDAAELTPSSVDRGGPWMPIPAW